MEAGVVVAALSWLAGACLLLRWPTFPEPVTVLAVSAASLLAAALARRPGLAAFALGFGLAWLQCGARLADRLEPALEGQTLQVAGRVASVPQASGAALRFRFAVDAGSGLPGRVELTWYEPDFRPLAAERLELEVRLRRPRGFANPGGGDYEARLLREGIGATGYVRAARRLGRSGEDVARKPVLVARDTIAAAIRDSLGERPAAGIVAGLSVGLQDALSPLQWRELARSGTTHLMAISGMHVGVFALVAGWTAGRLQRWRQRRGATRAARDVAVIAGSAAALGYAALAGWSVPAQRTALMIAIAAGALWWRRRVGPADAFAAGAIAVLLLQPLAPLAVGFWLSFGAVAAILLATAGESRSAGMLRGYAQTQWAVTAGLVPALVGSFGQVSLVSVLVNFVAIPLYTLLVVPAVLVATMLVLLIPAAGAVALGAVAELIEFTWPLISVPASWSWATWGVAAPGVVAWSLLLTGAAAALAPLPAPGRCAGLLLAVAACLWRPAAPAEGALRFTLLDVGQGLAAVVQTRRHVLVYDAGPAFRSGRDAGAIAVEPYLRARGLRHVDLLVASHDDLDHAGGAASLAGLVPVARLAASGQALDALGAVERCERGRRWQWDGVEFEWLHPGSAPPPGDNDASCVLRVRAGPHVLLLTGDIEASAESELVATGEIGPVALLTVPHHGSRTSSTAAFVAATRPRWALVAAGHRNRWGFPKPEVVQRWHEAGAQVLGGPSSGAIEFEIDPGREIAPPREWRKERRRAWHDP
jgi:competence protein ComEC